jgi:hypothetical protein
MATFSGLASLLWPRPDRRSAREIEADIRDELRFHVDEATDALVAGGVEPAQAREQALSRFGDIEHVRGACRRVQLGDRIMLQRIQWIVIAALTFALVALGFQSVNMRRRELAERELALAQLREAEAARSFLTAALADAQVGRATVEEVLRHADETAEQSGREEFVADLKVGKTFLAKMWFTRLKADPGNWREAIAIGDEIARMPDPHSALEVMQQLYPEMSLEQRQQIFKSFVFDGGHAMAVQILKLGAFDAEPLVRERAFLYLREYAFDDLSEWSSADLAAWYDRVGGKPLEQVLEASLRGLVARLSTADADELAKQMRLTHDLKFEAARKFDPACGAQLESAGLLAQIRSWSNSADGDVRAFALRAAGWLELDSNRLRSEVLSLMERNPEPPTAEVWTAYCNLVGQRGNTWATTPLIEHYRSELATSEHGGSLFGPAMALARIADPNAIPQMIGLLTAKDNADNRYAIGYYGLRELTGVAWDESHGAQWWNAWWQQNQSSFPGVTNTAIPTFSLSK